MLPRKFFDWWYEPWAYARVAPVHPMAKGRVGQRDGYRLWCDKSEVLADLPQQFDAAWHVAAIESSAHLVATARLFGGLIAARAHDQKLLRHLSLEERKWCVSIAATQPLAVCGNLPYDARDGIAVHGLVELVRRLEPAFPGMWSRLRLMLTPTAAARTDVLVEAATASGEKRENLATRAQRCWKMCQVHAEDVGIDAHSDLMAYADSGAQARNEDELVEA